MVPWRRLSSTFALRVSQRRFSRRFLAGFPALWQQSGTGADERLQDEAVHVASVLLPAPDQADGEVAAVLGVGFRGSQASVVLEGWAWRHQEDSRPPSPRTR